MQLASNLTSEAEQIRLEIIVPARNEAARLPDGLAKLCAKAATLPFGVAVIVVDNGSTDSTADIAKDWPAGPVPVRLVRCDARGKGAAVRAGLLASQAPYVGFCDADMATDLKALDDAVTLLAGGASAVVGSRALPDSVVDARHSIFRRIGAAAFRFAARLAAPGLWDTQCGFKFFSGPVARAAAAEMTSTGFAFDIELISRCQRLGRIPAIEIPVTWRDMPGSTFSVGRHAISAFWEVLGIWITLRRPRLAAGRVWASMKPGLPLMAGTRVAVVNWRDPWHLQAGGAERYAWEMATGLCRRGAAVRYVTSRGPGQGKYDQHDGVDIVRLGGRLTVYPRVLLWLLVRRMSFDAVIDCQNGIPFFTPWVLPRAVQILCVVHHVHDVQFGVHFPPVVAAVGRVLEGPVARWCYRRRACVAVSDSTARAMRARLRWQGPIHIVPNGLSAECFAAPGTDEHAPNAAGDACLLTVLGRLVAHKRVPHVLRIAERLAGTGVKIQIIGRGPEASRLDDEITARGLSGVVELRGYLPDPTMRAALAASVLHLSASQGEGWGLSVLEAAALGVPTVAYDVDGLRDAVRDGETGWLVREGELIEDVTERALKELADPARRAELAAACRSWAAGFEWDRSAGEMARLLLAGPSARAVRPVRGCVDDAPEPG
jgi:glycosyltransferase involved in cell wall biosynthesis